MMFYWPVKEPMGIFTFIVSQRYLLLPSAIKRANRTVISIFFAALAIQSMARLIGWKLNIGL
jgi:hypothetical protein